MIPAYLLRLAPYGIAVLLIVGGGFFVHQRAYNRGQAEVQAKFDAYKARQGAAVEKQLAANAKLQNEHDLLKWKHDDEIRKRLAADSRSADLAARLRQFYANNSPLPEDPTTPSGAEGGGGVPASPDPVDEAVRNALDACRNDSLKLQGWQEWWKDIENSINFTLTFPSP